MKNLSLNEMVVVRRPEDVEFVIDLINEAFPDVLTWDGVTIEEHLERQMEGIKKFGIHGEDEGLGIVVELKNGVPQISQATFSDDPLAILVGWFPSIEDLLKTGDFTLYDGGLVA